MPSLSSPYELYLLNIHLVQSSSAQPGRGGLSTKGRGVVYCLSTGRSSIDSELLNCLVVHNHFQSLNQLVSMYLKKRVLSGPRLSFLWATSSIGRDGQMGTYDVQIQIHIRRTQCTLVKFKTLSCRRIRHATKRVSPRCAST